MRPLALEPLCGLSASNKQVKHKQMQTAFAQPLQLWTCGQLRIVFDTKRQRCDGGKSELYRVSPSEITCYTSGGWPPTDKISLQFMKRLCFPASSRVSIFPENNSQPAIFLNLWFTSVKVVFFFFYSIFSSALTFKGKNTDWSAFHHDTKSRNSKLITKVRTSH